ncbi:dnaJ homolog subfamily C member 15-like [Cuculus canorus]|uniref:dnaJ homolog subfamily C member 15-like n=1 Tax=Cuculus canorus TaxID=55661 RepID=UPI0023AB14A7|nr:dnaJ homolog subfamily C member 15-like [Cuculus canorus]
MLACWCWWDIFLAFKMLRNFGDENDWRLLYSGRLKACALKSILGIDFATVASAIHYAFHIWKPVEQAVTETAKRISNSSLSSNRKGGFEQKMSKQEASLILFVSPFTGRTKIRTAQRRIMILNHPDKDGSPHLSTKINEAKDLSESTDND